jgi:hypothetical protein
LDTSITLSQFHTFQQLIAIFITDLKIIFDTLSYPAFGDIEVEQYVEHQYPQYYMRSDPFHKFRRRVHYFEANSCSGKCDSEGQCNRGCSCLAITYGSGICVAEQMEWKFTLKED